MKKMNTNEIKALARRGLVLMLVAVMVIGILPTGSVLATETPGESSEPTVETTVAAGETTAPSETTEATEAPSETTQPSETTEPSTEATEPSTEATQPSTEATDPTEESTEATEASAYEQIVADLDALAEEAKTLEATVEACDAFYASAKYVYGVAFDLYEVDKFTGEEWSAIDAKFVSIVDYLKNTYGYENGTISPLTVPTGSLTKNGREVSGVAENTTIHLFNYNTQIDNASNAVLRFKAQVATSSSQLEAYYGRDAFLPDGTNEKYSDVTNDDGGNTVGTPTMKLNLSNGYPDVASVSNGSNVPGSGSLDYLFDPNMSVTGKEIHTITNDGSGTGLFQKNSDGYYYYDSADNHAEYVNGKFQLYNFALRPYGGRVQNRGQGHFLPFNHDVSGATQLTDENRNWVVTPKVAEATTPENEVAYWQSVNLWDSTNNKVSYNSDSNNAKMGKNVWVLGNVQPIVGDSDFETKLAQLPDYWFGMSVEFTFNITEVNNQGRPVIVTDSGEKEMIFSFLGDDDVFVYIDDVLVLDLGGGSCDYGEINFTQGTSKEIGGSASSVSSNADGTNTEVKNIADIFNAAIKEKDSEATANYSYDTEFAKYTTHTLKFFYLERGTGTANCELKFNMEPMPAGAVNVTKALTEDSVLTEETEDDLYTFRLLEEKNGSFDPVSEAVYKIGTGEYKTDGNGEFTLKQGQTASFTELAAETNVGKKFKVVELNNKNKNATFDSVAYYGSTNGRAVDNYAEFTIYPSDQDNRYTHYVVFTNKLNTVDVTIDKTVTGNMGDRDKKFTYSVSMYADAEKKTPINFVAAPEDTSATNPLTFDMSHNDSAYELKNVPVGAYLVITETDTDYEESYKVNGNETATTGNEVTLACVKADQTVEFINDKEVTIDTGISLDAAPFVLILAIAAGGFVLLRKRRSFDD